MKTGIANKKVALETKVRSTVTRLQQVATLAVDQRNSLSASANAAFTKFKHTLSDERATHPIFMRVAKIVSVSCLGIILLNLASAQQPSAKPPYVRTSEPVPAAPLELPAPAQRQQASMSSAPHQAPAALPSMERRANDTTRQSDPLATGSSGDAAKNAPTSQYTPSNFRELALLPSSEAQDSSPPLPPPIQIPPRSTDIGQLPAAPVGTAAKPKLNPSVPSDAAQIQQRLFDLGFLPTSADGKWGQRSARALQEFRAAHNLKNDTAWDLQTEDALLSPPATPETTLLFAGNWRSEDETCGADGHGPPLRITSSRAETAGGRCDFDSVRRESESAWRVRAKCFVNGETWQANIQLRLTGQRLTWSSEHGRAQYLRTG